jgi:prophage maintenance system killer protein
MECGISDVMKHFMGNIKKGIYTGCNKRNGTNFARVFLMLNYTDITQNTYVQS